MDRHLPPFTMIIFVSEALACKFFQSETTPYKYSCFPVLHDMGELDLQINLIHVNY